MDTELGRKGFRNLGWAGLLYVLSYITLKSGFSLWWVIICVATPFTLLGIANLSDWYKSLPQ